MSVRTSLMIGLVAVGVSACAGSQQRTVNVAKDAIVPAAEAELALSERGPNTGISLEVQHLAMPQDVDGRASAYVGWVRPLDRQGAPQNVGALRRNKDGNHLEASLDTVTPFETFELFVTAEPTENAVSPGGPRVLWATVR